ADDLEAALGGDDRVVAGVAHGEDVRDQRGEPDLVALGDLEGGDVEGRAGAEGGGGCGLVGARGRGGEFGRVSLGIRRRAGGALRGAGDLGSQRYGGK